MAEIFKQRTFPIMHHYITFSKKFRRHDSKKKKKEKKSKKEKKKKEKKKKRQRRDSSSSDTDDDRKRWAHFSLLFCESSVCDTFAAVKERNSTKVDKTTNALQCNAVQKTTTPQTMGLKIPNHCSINATCRDRLL